MTTPFKTSGARTGARYNPVLRLCMLLLWLAMATATLAQPAAGHYGYPTFSGDGNSIWDLSGSYTLLESFWIQIPGGSARFHGSMDINVVQDLQGRLHGSGTLRYDNSLTGNLDGTCTLNGSVRVVGSATLVVMTVKAAGTTSIGGTNHFSLSLRYNLQIDPFALKLFGHSKGTLVIPGLPRTALGSEGLLPVPAGMDGSWRLSMDIDDGSGNNGADAARSLAQKFTGGAVIRLSNGNLISCAMNGSYNEPSGHSRARISGSGAGLTLNSVQSKLAITDFTGKVLGQKIHAAFASPVGPDSAPTGGGGGGSTSGRLTGWKSGCTGWSMGISGEDFSSTSRQSNFQYDFYNRVIREYGTITAIRTGRTYSYDARYSYDFGGCFSSVTMTVSGGLLSPSSQTITF